MKRSLLFFALAACTAVCKAQGTINDGLIAHYDFNGNANDKTGTPANGVVSSAMLTTGFRGEVNSAYRFSQNTHRIMVPQSAKLDFLTNDSLTFSFWMKNEKIPDLDGRILCFYNAAANAAVEINLWSKVHGADSGKVEILNFDGNTMTAKLILPTDSAVRRNTWEHITVTLVVTDSLTSGIYMNGRLAAQKKSVFSLFGNGALCIGNNPTQNWYFPGVIDDVRIYNRVITQQEIDMLSGKTFVTGITKRSNAAQEISVYPNPSAGLFKIDAGQGQFDKVDVMNIMGETVLSSGYTSQVDLSGASKGIYFLRLSLRGKPTGTKKLIVE